jgi:hypothetical protein
MFELLLMCCNNVKVQQNAAIGLQMQQLKWQYMAAG